MYIPARCREGDTLPEPNIGHADLLKSFPAGVIVTGIELDTLNCLISRAKGYDTTEADFLTWSKSNQQKKFDYVVMNPPLPITRAASPGSCISSRSRGSLAAVLPLSLQGLDNLLGKNSGRNGWTF